MIEREKLKLTGEEGRHIVYEVHEDFERVKSKIVNSTRWSIVYEDVYQRLSDKKFFKTTYSVGATEMQDEIPYEYGDAVFIQVFPIERTITLYE